MLQHVLGKEGTARFLVIRPYSPSLSLCVCVSAESLESLGEER